MAALLLVEPNASVGESGCEAPGVSTWTGAVATADNPACTGGDGIWLSAAGLDSRTTGGATITEFRLLFDALANVAPEGFLDCGLPEAGTATFREFAVPALLAVSAAARSCAAASADAKPLAPRWPDGVWAMAGIADTLFEMDSRIGFTANASFHSRKARMTLMHSSRQQTWQTGKLAKGCEFKWIRILPKKDAKPDRRSLGKV
jgi:hypothetical protein